VRRDATEQTSPVKIAGNVGQLNSTANTFGLWTLGAEILPALKRRIGSGNFEVQIYGRFKPRPFVERWLADPDVRVRGFVDDIDAEILSCPIYLLANNRHAFKVGHTRILHAFALGACVVAWRDIAVSMPELKHNENVLLADTPEEMAALVAVAAEDKALRRRIGWAGFKTVGTLFRPDTLMAEMGHRIRGLVADRHRSAHA
jgi:hypothetical protein